MRTPVFCRPGGPEILFICDPGAAGLLRSPLPLATLLTRLRRSHDHGLYAALTALATNDLLTQGRVFK
jgi:hypothetical protein